MPGLIVHEWIDEFGGSENVLEAMASAFPDAEIACLWNNAPDRFKGRTVRESWLSKTPLRRNKALALPFMPTTWASMDVNESDFVLVSSHLFAHHVGGRMPASGPTKFVYVHTPARYIWASEFDHRGRNFVAKAVSPLLKKIDATKAAQGAAFAANSEFVRARILDAWDQDAVVIYPPVRIDRLQAGGEWCDHLFQTDEAVLSSLPGEFILAASRFVSYKRLEIAIRAGEAADIPVVIAGSGPLRAELAARGLEASVPVYMVDNPSDELLYALYQAAGVFIFPAVEDFGIMPVEAMCLGTPAIVPSEGGAAESVKALRGGVILDSFSRESLAEGVSSAMRTDMSFARNHAQGRFGEAAFSSRLTAWMAAVGAKTDDRRSQDER